MSICIPTYEMKGDGSEFLNKLLQSISLQSFSDFEVVVSDQSTDEEVLQVCERWRDRLQLRHVWNRDSPRRSSTNCNNAIDHARSDLVKIIFQDDFLTSAKALETIYAAVNFSERNWLLCGSGVSFDGKTVEREIVPKLTNRMRFGRNTVSSPSVLAFKKSCNHRFDESLVWLMDVEFYQRLWEDCGMPIVVKETLVCNNLHSGQVSASVSNETKISELKYVWKKYKKRRSISGFLEYYKRRVKLWLDI